MQADQLSLLVEGCILVIVNATAILVVIVTTLKKRQSKMIFNNVLLGFLFMSHLLAGAVNALQVIFEVKGETHLALLAVSILYFLTSLEITFTITISLERYIAIQKPFLYGRLTKTHGACVIVAAPIFSAVFIILQQFSAVVFLVGFGAIFLGAVSIIITNLHLYRSVRGQCVRIKSLTVADTRAEVTQHKADVNKRQLKSLKICLLISVSYVCTWVPLSIYMVVLKTTPGIVLTLYPDVLGFSNGIWDVLIFFYLNKTARRTLHAMVCKGYCKSSKLNSIQPSSFAGEFNRTQTYLADQKTTKANQVHEC